MSFSLPSLTASYRPHSSDICTYEKSSSLLKILEKRSGHIGSQKSVMNLPTRMGTRSLSRRGESRRICLRVLGFQYWGVTIVWGEEYKGGIESSS